MKPRLIPALLALLSASVLCFEIVSTRVASVVFASDFAFIILSLAVLGLGIGGILSYRFAGRLPKPQVLVERLLLGLGAALALFIVSVTTLALTSPVLFAVLVLLPFVCGGVLYAQLYREQADASFTLYAFDLGGAAVGSLGALGLLSWLGAPNTVLLLAAVMVGMGLWLSWPRLSRRVAIGACVALGAGVVVVLLQGRRALLPEVPIGNFPEKDFHHVYVEPGVHSSILDSRWSIYGRADLVGYSHQDKVRQLFVDGAAGSQVYRFNGNIRNTGSDLQALLLHHTNAIPFLCMEEREKGSMLIIGPGGGKEVLMGLFGGVKSITGVEVNPDFVEIVRDHREFDGGIYSDFPNVTIQVEEGRHFVRQSGATYDLLVMALPSTAQMQNIEPFAANENFLLTKEAIRDYLDVLRPDGRMIITVHNDWELARLLTTTVSVLHDLHVRPDLVDKYFVVFEAQYAPTVVIKKRPFSIEEALHWQEVCKGLPADFPPVTYLPYGLPGNGRSPVGLFLQAISRSDSLLQADVARSPMNIAPCTDDRPYFYNSARTVPAELLWLLGGVAGFGAMILWLPAAVRRGKVEGKKRPSLRVPLLMAGLLGAGFMLLEVSLLQRLVLSLGSPTISLSILLASVLVGMGLGSFAAGKRKQTDLRAQIILAGLLVVGVGVLLFLVSPLVLNLSLQAGILLRALVCFGTILPLAFFLGVMFPSCLRLVQMAGDTGAIPWVYGVNGVLSVVGSVLAIVLSMLVGFTATFFVGLACYLCLVIFAWKWLAKAAHAA